MREQITWSVEGALEQSRISNSRKATEFVNGFAVNRGSDRPGPVIQSGQIRGAKAVISPGHPGELAQTREQARRAPYQPILQATDYRAGLQREG